MAEKMDLLNEGLNGTHTPDTVKRPQRVQKEQDTSDLKTAEMSGVEHEATSASCIEEEQETKSTAISSEIQQSRRATSEKVNRASTASQQDSTSKVESTEKSVKSERALRSWKEIIKGFLTSSPFTWKEKWPEVVEKASVDFHLNTTVGRSVSSERKDSSDGYTLPKYVFRDLRDLLREGFDRDIDVHDEYGGMVSMRGGERFVFTFETDEEMLYDLDRYEGHCTVMVVTSYDKQSVSVTMPIEPTVISKYYKEIVCICVEGASERNLRGVSFISGYAPLRNWLKEMGANMGKPTESVIVMKSDFQKYIDLL